MLDEVIDRGGVNATQLAERGKIYLEIAKIKADGTEEDKYLLPKDTSDECYLMAIRNLSDAIGEDGEVAEYYYLRGQAKYYATTSDCADAIDDFQKAIDLDDTVPDYYFYSARAWYDMSTFYPIDRNEEIQNALTCIESAIKTYMEEESDFDEESEDESESDAETDADDESADELRHLNEDKSLAEYYYYAGLIYTSIGDDRSLREAIKRYKNAVRCDSENADYALSLGIAYYTLDDPTKAVEAFDCAISIDKDKSDYYNEGYHLAWKAHLIENESIDDAIDIYEESLKFRENYAYTYKRLAELYKEKGDDASVKNVYSRAVKYSVDDTSFYYYASGVMHYDEGNYNDTIRAMEKAVEDDDSYKADAYYYMGCSSYYLQNYSEAYKYYKLAKKVAVRGRMKLMNI